MTPRNRSFAEHSRVWDQRPDSGLYFDPVTTSLGPVGVPRVFVPRYKLQFQDHFLGDSIDARWNESTNGTPTGASIQNAKNGVVRLAIAATSEAELDELNFNDILQFDTTSGLVMEIAFRFTTAVTTAQSAYFGFGSARNNTYASIARRAGFSLNADMNLAAVTDDATTDTGLIDTLDDLTAGRWHYGRIECISASRVDFYSGPSTTVRVASATTFSIGSTLVQPILSCQKASGSGTTSLEVDYVGIWARR
jgi:hypothetical protein